MNITIMTIFILGTIFTIGSVIMFFCRAWNEMNALLVASVVSWMAFFYRLVGGS